MVGGLTVNQLYIGSNPIQGAKHYLVVVRQKPIFLGRASISWMRATEKGKNVLWPISLMVEHTPDKGKTQVRFLYRLPN